MLLAIMPGTLYYGKILDTTIFGVTGTLLVFSSFVFYAHSAPGKNTVSLWRSDHASFAAQGDHRVCVGGAPGR